MARTLKPTKKGEKLVIEEGQIWKENDPRNERYVKVIRADSAGGDILIEGCMIDGTKRPRARQAWAKADRFNGKAGGYSLSTGTVENV